MSRLPTEPGEESGELRCDVEPGDETAPRLPSPEQDRRDTIRCAEGFLLLVRCSGCKRITVRDYICIHCGYDSSG